MDVAKRGKIEFYPDAPDTWPDFAHFFHYQEGSGDLVLMQPAYSSPPDVHKMKHVDFRQHEKLAAHMDFTDWEDDVWHNKTFQNMLLHGRRDMLGVVKWAALDKALQDRITLLIRKTAADATIPKAEFIHTLMSKAGAYEWLEFNLRKICRKQQTDTRHKLEQILFNATVDPSGNNVKFVLNKLLHAVATLCESGDWPWRVGCMQLIRAFKHCSIRNIAAEVRKHKITVQTGDVHTVHEYDFLDHNKNRSDPDSNSTDINWETRWSILKTHATQLVDQLCSSVRQLNFVSEDLFPVYIPGWKSIDVTGQMNVGVSGPVPPSSKNRLPLKDTRSGRSADSGRTRSYDTKRSMDDRRQRDFGHKRARASLTLRTAPPSFSQQLAWYMNRQPLCLACGAEVSDHKIRDCPSRNTHFPTFDIDFPRLKEAKANSMGGGRSVSTVVATPTVSERLPPPPPPFSQAPIQAPMNLGSRYAHRDDRTGDGQRNREDRPRSRSRDTRDEQIRERDRSTDRERAGSLGRTQDFRPTRSGQPGNV